MYDIAVIAIKLTGVEGESSRSEANEEKQLNLHGDLLKELLCCYSKLLSDVCRTDQYRGHTFYTFSFSKYYISPFVLRREARCQAMLSKQVCEMFLKNHFKIQIGVLLCRRKLGKFFEMAHDRCSHIMIQISLEVST